MNPHRRQRVKAARLALALAMALLAGAALPATASGQLVRRAAGAAPADIQATVDLFRTDLGTLNPNVAGSAGSGRREINWDGVPDALAAPNNLPANFFNVNSPRGVVLSTPGTGFQVSANAGITPTEFGNIDLSYQVGDRPEKVVYCDESVQHLRSSRITSARVRWRVTSAQLSPLRSMLRPPHRASAPVRIS